MEVRRQLAEGGQAAIEASDDPLIRLFRQIEPEYRRLREINDELDELNRQAYAEIDEAKVALEGTSGYPDATFTLRLAFGEVKGYEEDGEQVAAVDDDGRRVPITKRSTKQKSRGSCQSRGTRQKTKSSKSTPLNFVCTADIIGGNSGSPVINRAGELVGLIFDSNIQGLTASYFYDDQVARAVSVHSSAIREALRNIYNAPELADQLGR